MNWKSEQYIKKEFVTLLTNKKINYRVDATVPVTTGSACIDVMFINNNNLFLIEINNGVKVDIDDVSNLKKAEEYFLNRNQKPKLIILTEDLDKIDTNIKHLARDENIKIITTEEMKKIL